MTENWQFNFTINNLQYCTFILQLDSSEKGGKDDERRAFWLDTRDLEDNFKELIFLSLQEVDHFFQLRMIVRLNDTF